LTPGVAKADPKAPVADDTLVPVDALVRRLVVGVTWVALAAEAADGVHADAVLAHSFKKSSNFVKKSLRLSPVIAYILGYNVIALHFYIDNS
jgi:hypothetical protein